MEVKSRSGGVLALAVVLAALLSLCLGIGGTAHASAAAAAPSSTASPSPVATKEIKPADCSKPAAAKKGALPTARCFAQPLTDSAGDVAVRPALAGPPSTALGPQQIQSAYKLPDAGVGKTVAVVDAYGYASAEADLGVFRSYYGLPACTSADGCFTKVDENGGTNYPPEDSGWSIETALDLDAVSSACPDCKILLVEADSENIEDLGQGVDTAVNMGAVAVSNSYGGYEGSDELTLDPYYDHPGVAVTVSAGDSGYGPSYPATSPDVVSVGGTALTAASGTSRGWTESVWNSSTGATGSGCSAYEPQPTFQAGLSTDCPNGRADNDISADADPDTGLGIYNSSALGGWSQYGGTSLSSPLVAAMYALAGTPTPGTYPATYPYRDTSALNDVTTGNDGDCGNVLCQAGPGWDGPTGLGTPEGVTALSEGAVGQVAGTATDSATGAAVSGMTITATDSAGNAFKATTAADGTYDLYAPVGTYTVTATKYGYSTKTVDSVAVTDGSSTTEDFSVTALPTQTVSGYVTDGSGHDWPMRAKITIAGYPGGAIYSNPYTGYYSVSLPEGTSYQISTASAGLSGYLGQTDTVAVGSQPVRKDIALDVDSAACDAPGYAFHDVGLSEAFTGWKGASAQDGWSISDNVGNGQTWDFTNDYHMAPPQGGDADFASVSSEYWGADGKQDTSLITPVIDLSGQSNPELQFDNEYIWFPGETATVDLSLDGGTTWTTAWSAVANDAPVSVPLPQAADQSDVKLRFHFTGADGRGWNLDNVFIGTQTCQAQPGGLLAGVVTDANTGDPLDGATVTSVADPTQIGVTAATPDDAGLTDGYYELFSTQTGKTGFTVTDGQYAATTANAAVAPDTVVHQDFKLDAGRLTVSKQSLSMTETLGAATAKTVTLGNDGTAPLNVSLGESDAGFTAMGASTSAKTAVPNAPKSLVKAQTSTSAKAAGGAKASAGSAGTAGPRVAAPDATTAGGSWTNVADYPSPVMDDAVATDSSGKVYVIGGSDGYGPLDGANVFDPATGAWSPIANLPEPLNAESAQFLGDTLYVTGGWGEFDTNQNTYAYHPATDTWTKEASLPTGVAGAGSAVVDGDLYIVGGCTTDACTPSSAAVYSYDPGNNTWSTHPDYPTAVAFVSCGGVDSEVVCAGGSGSSSLSSTYTYAPGAAGWTQKANMPVDDWGAASASANGELEVLGGAIENGSVLTNQNFAYDPASDTWSALPNSSSSTYRAGAACGIYEIGGDAGGFNPTQVSQHLPGYDQCGSSVAWMTKNQTTLTLAPGQTASVSVTADSSAVSQPGTYQGELTIDDDSPYPSAVPVTVTMNVNPPKAWGKIAGTVDDASGKPITGATVAICTMYDTKTGTCGPVTYTLQTDAAGDYQLWLNKGFNPLEVIAAKDGYTPLLKIAKLTAGQTTTVPFTLTSSSAVTQSTVQNFLNSRLHVRAVKP